MPLDVVVDPVLQALKVNVLDGANALAEGEQGVFCCLCAVKTDSTGLLWYFDIVLIFKRHA